MFEIDFHPVDCESSAGSTKSGDAITIRFTGSDGQQKVVVIDAGFQATGDRLVEHIHAYYDTDHVDLAVSTHPDGDHLNGLGTIIENLDVDELMIHQPRQHAGPRISGFSNLEAVDALLDAARAHGTQIADPFTGAERFNGQLVVLGPDKQFYERLIDEYLDSLVAEKSMTFPSIRKRAKNLLDSAIGGLPLEETLTDLGETSPRNESSVITLLTVDDVQLLFTGDAGQRALSRAADEYEARLGSFGDFPLAFFQPPHHGSRRNLGPTILDRVLGSRDAPHGTPISIISAAASSPKHPSPKVVNALTRRGARVVATLGTTISWGRGAPARPGWTPANPLPPLSEDDDPDE